MKKGMREEKKIRKGKGKGKELNNNNLITWK
jgi:hypothetical protein